MSKIRAFSTDNLSPKQALAYWMDCVSATFTQLQVDPVERSCFRASLEMVELGYLRLAMPVSVPAVVSRPRARIAKAEEDAFMLHMQISNGTSRHQQCGNEAVLGAGDYTLCDSLRPYELAFDTSNTMLVMVIPREELRKRLADPESIVCLPISGQTGLGRLCSQFVRTTWEQRGHGYSENDENRLADNVLDVLATACAGARRKVASETSVTAARRIMLREFIEIHLDNPDLSPPFIATATGYTTSYLHQLFRKEDETLSRYILRRRLEKCARDLRSGQRSRTISEIAYRWGFNNMTHFHRLFRRHFDMTPREYRVAGKMH